MPASRTARLAVAAVLGIAAGAALWFRAAAIEPFIDIKADLLAHPENLSVWNISVTARGGETIDEVRIEEGTGPVGLPPADIRTFRTLKPGWTTGFRVTLEGPRTVTGSVRIVQSGRVSRTYEVPLEVKP